MKEYEVIVLGPGPGHYSDYFSFISLLEKIVGEKKILGICLGHQMLAHLFGLECFELERPFHGESRLLPNFSQFIEEDNVLAQLYNSWGVRENLNLGKDIKVVTDLSFVVALVSRMAVSVQFHPESVGTNCPHSVFEKLINLLYNRFHEHTGDGSLRSKDN